MENALNFITTNWIYIAAGAALLISILNAVSKHWSEKTGLIKVLLFVIELLSILTSKGTLNGAFGKAKLPLTSIKPRGSA